MTNEILQQNIENAAKQFSDAKDLKVFNEVLKNAADVLGSKAEENTIAALAGIRQDALVEANRLESKIKPNSQFMRQNKMYNVIRFFNHVWYGAPRYGWGVL
jgi:repressor of nif and glnA expression